jgi:hypothetical protein
MANVGAFGMRYRWAIIKGEPGQVLRKACDDGIPLEDISTH